MTLFNSPDFSPEAARSAHNGRVDTRQWRAQALHLCNWGGFGGRHAIRFDPDSTLLSGASGAGKSTILDAFTILMQAPGASMNSASNDTATGRGRKEGSRTALTYVRGQYAWTVDHDDEMRPQVLRGRDQDTWSAVSLVFIADTGEKFSLLRLFYASHTAARSVDIPARYGTYEGAFDLLAIEPWAHERFPQDKMKRAIPGLEFFPSYLQYAEHFQTRLGIGDHGDGAKAMRLLANIQRGHRIDTVDGLYKQMVLERPTTFEKADTAVESFDRLDDAHRQMRRAEQQIAVLMGMVDEHDELISALEDAQTVDEYRADSDRSPFALWMLNSKFDLYESESAATRTARDDLRDLMIRLERERDDLTELLSEVDRQWRDAGGDQIADLERRLRILTERLGVVEAAVATTAATIAALNIEVPATAAEFADTQRVARTFLSAYPADSRALDGRYRQAVQDAGAAAAGKRDLDAEIESLSNRRGNIDTALHQARLRFAHVAGLAADDLPFVGELIDVEPDFEDWRIAADAVLGAFARTLLIDERNRRTLSRAINSLTDRFRLRFTGVDVFQADPGAGSGDTLAGRLIVQQGPFAGWLRRNLNSNYNYVCVETADELGDDNVSRVTRSGQTKERRRGAHGGHHQRVIGFTNAARIADLQVDSDRAGADRDAADALAGELKNLIDGLRDRKAGWDHMMLVRWDDLDVAHVRAGIQEVTATRDALLAAEDTLAALTDRRAALNKRLNEKIEAVGVARNDRELRHKAWEKLADEQEKILFRLDQAERDPAIVLTDAQAIDLDSVLAATPWDGTLAQFDRNIAAAKTRLADRRNDANSKVQNLTNRLTGRFTRFQDQWYDPNRHTSVESYDLYRDILTALVEQGLAEQRANWERKVTEWGGEDLAELLLAYDATLEQINERLVPINNILASIPFGSTATTLRIDVTQSTPLSVRQFKDQLRASGRYSMNPNTTEGEIAERFEALRAVIARIRSDSANPQRTSREYDLLLDVRRHIKVRAQQLDAAGRVTETFAYLGDLSGGETQELIAFIVGAALRYQLGDQNRDQPRFAPVVLDEGFIKADSRHAGRAVDAWKRLGFQLIIGAPEGQFTALEKAMNLIVAVTKDSDEQSFATPMIKS